MQSYASSKLLRKMLALRLILSLVMKTWSPLIKLMPWDGLSMELGQLDFHPFEIIKSAILTLVPNLIDRTGDLLHKTGRFLPWHRGFLLAHETILRKECGYTGHIPYWNWSWVLTSSWMT